MNAVERAINDLRRAMPVVIIDADGGAGTSVLAVAAETLTPRIFLRLNALTPGAAALCVTARRAAALAPVTPPVTTRATSPVTLGAEGTGVIRLPLAPGTEARVARAWADPTSCGGPAPAPTEARSVPAAGPEGAAVALAGLARLLPAAVTAPAGGGGELEAWAAAQDLLTVRAGDVFAYRDQTHRMLEMVAEARVPLAEAEAARLIAFRPRDGGREHLALVIGDPAPGAPVLTRLHSECFTGDLLGSLRCDCGDQLRGAIAAIGAVGTGVLLYLAQEGRGIGLVNKLRSYRLQDQGLDTIDANECLGFEADARVYAPAAAMLHHLGFDRVRLLTNNPDKISALEHHAIQVTERVPHVFPANGHNEGYLRTKARRRGHLL